MESEEITKMVDGVYKNILEKFNPGARQLITAGKGYLKSLHGAATSARVFNEALAKIAMNAQHSGTGDIGAALLSVVSVYKEIQEQQMNILKAFYVDLLVPLETNLEKDTKVVQHEQKKFLQQHKVRMESFQKAVTTMKKQRKKKASPENTEKELRTLQILEDQKKKLDAFCEQSYKNAMTQERRRYGFVLERQCSIAKHWMAYHSTGKQVIDNHLENWQEIATSREMLPTTVYDGNSLLVGNKRLERLKDSEDSQANGSSSNLLKKSRSVDAPFGDMRSLHIPFTQNSLPRAKSDFNLNSSANSNSTNALTANDHSENGHWDQRTVVKALYAYMPSGENQLPFEEGDRIALVGSKAKGWQFGENLRTQMFGWFPIAYTNAELMVENKIKSEREQHTSRSERFDSMHYERHGGGGGGGGVNGSGNGQAMRNSYHDQYMDSPQEMDSDNTYRRQDRTEESSPTRMFGDTYRNQKKYRPSASGNPRPGPPPTLPAPVPSVPNGSRMLNSSQSFCAPNGSQMAIERRKQKLQNGNQINHQSSMNQMKPAAAAKTSLHSSNDSGFANEPPPQPEVDYSDDEQPTSRVPIRRRADTNSHISTNREIASWTLNRNFRSSIDSQIDDRSLKTLNRNSTGKMRYDLIASDDEILQASSGGIKRTKSFWKFGGGRHEDILAGMSLWQHRDLVATPNVEELRDEGYRTTSSKMESEKEMERNDTLTKSNSNHSTSSQEKRGGGGGGGERSGGSGVGGGRKESLTSMEMYDDDENIYGLTPMVREPMLNRGGVNNFTPKSRMKIMKTIEIDIENPGENERLSTIKRNQKEYRESMSNRNSMNESNKKSQNSMNNRNSSSGGNSKNKMSSSNGQQGKNSNTQSNRNPPPDMFPSTESEAGESELDNGTLKMSDVNNFFDSNNNSGGGIIMKTVKRKDILKQYYTSEDDSDDPEIKSTSSDPYDCIVINDHLVRRDEKQRRAMHALQQEHQMEFQTFRATTSSSTTAAAAAAAAAAMNQNSSSSNGTSKKKSSERHQAQQERERERERDRERDRDGDRERNNRSSKSYPDQQQDIQMRQYSDSTLTRHQSNSALSTPTATILPRTRLMKSSNMSSMTLERNSTSSAQKAMHSSNSDRERERERMSASEKHYGKTYGPWYDFWDQPEQSVKSNKMK